MVTALVSTMPESSAKGSQRPARGARTGIGFLLGCILATGLLQSCAAVRRQSVDPNATLYDRLGGRPGLTAVLADFTRKIEADERINGFFIGVDTARVEAQLYDQICAATGGPCQYTGREMRSLHTGMNITEAQFQALVEDLVKSLDQHGVPDREKTELLTLLGSMKNDIINR